MNGISQFGETVLWSKSNHLPKLHFLHLKVRGRQLGKLLLATLTLLARKQGCYKVTLNCADPMVKFYNGFGFRCEEGDANFMALRLWLGPNIIWQWHCLTSNIAEFIPHCDQYCVQKWQLLPHQNIFNIYWKGVYYMGYVTERLRDATMSASTCWSSLASPPSPEA